MAETTDRPAITVAKAVECGIGIAQTKPGCDLCERRDRACPEHAAASVLWLLADVGYIVTPAGVSR